MRILLLLCLVACDKGRADPSPIPPPTPPVPVPADGRALSCDEARPIYEEMVKAQERALQDALRARGLMPANLEEVWVTDGPELDVQDDALQVIAQVHEGKPRNVIVTYSYDRADEPYFPPRILVVDANGRVWHVRKKLAASPTRTIDVEACQWGCFRPPPRGHESAPDPGRHGWLLRDGQGFVGELVIDVVAPHIEFRPTRTACAPPA